jgi:hypothetical protein
MQPCAALPNAFSYIRIKVLISMNIYELVGMFLTVKLGDLIRPAEPVPEILQRIKDIGG